MIAVIYTIYVVNYICVKIYKVIGLYLKRYVGVTLRDKAKKCNQGNHQIKGSSAHSRDVDGGMISI